MSNFFSLLTQTGQQKLTTALANEEAVQLTHMAVGDGNGNVVNPDESMTALVNEVYRASLSNLSIDPENPNWLIAELTIPMAEGGFTIREAGLFNDQGDLMAIAKMPETEKPVAGSGTAREIIIRFYLQVENTDAVNLTINPTIATASRDFVEGYVAQQISNIPAKQATTTVLGNVELATVDEAKSGIDAERAVTPIGLMNAILDQLSQLQSKQPEQSFTANTTYTVPAGVHYVTIEAFGAGGGGGCSHANPDGTGPNAQSGQDTQVSLNGTVIMTAKGGLYGDAGSVWDTKRANLHGNATGGQVNIMGGGSSGGIGGSENASSDYELAGRTGGNGGYCRSKIQVSAGDTLQLTVGQGGAGITKAGAPVTKDGTNNNVDNAGGFGIDGLVTLSF